MNRHHANPASRAGRPPTATAGTPGRTTPATGPTRDLELITRHLVRALRHGRHAAAAGGPDTGAPEFFDLRPYRGGDDPRVIDWRVFGRTDRLFTRRAPRFGQLTVDLRLDASLSMAFAGWPSSSSGSGFPASKWAMGTTIAGCVARMALQQGDQCGLRIVAGRGTAGAPELGIIKEEVAAGTGPAHLARLLRTLETAQPAGAVGLSDLLAPPARHEGARGPRLIVLLTDALEPLDALERGLTPFARSYRRPGGEDTMVSMIRILAPTERDLGPPAETNDLERRRPRPTDGPRRTLRVIDPECEAGDAENQPAVTHEVDRVAWPALFAAHEAQLQRAWAETLGAGRGGLPLITISADEPPLDALRRMLWAWRLAAGGGRGRGGTGTRPARAERRQPQ